MKWLTVQLLDILLETSKGTWGQEPTGDESDYPVLRSTNIQDGQLILKDIAVRAVSYRVAQKCKLQQGDILVTTSSGSQDLIGKNALFNDPQDGNIYLFSNFIQRVRPNTKLIIPRYLHLYLNSRQAKSELIRIQNTTSGLRNLNTNLYLSQLIPLPPLSEQRRIVEILDQADALRRKRAETDARAERILPALFIKMFGDPATNPKGWEMVPLAKLSVGTPQYGANAKAIDWFPNAPRYIRITDILDNGELGDEMKTLELEDWKPYVLEEGDLLFARSGATVGKTYLYQTKDGLCAFAGYLIRFKIDRSQIDPWVVFALTKTPYYLNWVLSKKRTAAQPNINAQEFASLLVPKPKKELQVAFADALQKLLYLRSLRNEAYKKLEETFTLLLHRAFSGDLTAKWREAHMQELLAEMEEQARLLQNEPVQLSFT